MTTNLVRVWVEALTEFFFSLLQSAFSKDNVIKNMFDYFRIWWRFFCGFWLSAWWCWVLWRLNLAAQLKRKKKIAESGRYGYFYFLVYNYILICSFESPTHLNSKVLRQNCILASLTGVYLGTFFFQYIPKFLIFWLTKFSYVQQCYYSEDCASGFICRGKPKGTKSFGRCYPKLLKV